MGKQKTQVINGVTYVYKDKAIWNAQKKYGTHKREYIGKMVDGAFVPNDKFQLKQALAVAKEARPSRQAKRLFFGATYLFDQLGERLGIVKDLHACFPGIYRKILSMAYFLVMEDRNPLSRFPKWARTHSHPYGEVLTSQRSSELLEQIHEDGIQKFFKLQVERRLEIEYLAYDTTSISSYSKTMKRVRYGLNKDHDPLPQINLALVYGQESHLPVCYRVLPGNITDVSTVRTLIEQLTCIKGKKIRLVMDRGFYSAENVNALLLQHYSFLIGIRSNIKLVKDRINAVRSSIVSRANYSSRFGVYCTSSTETWSFTEVKSRTGQKICHNRRVYLHVYYNEQKALDERSSFYKMLDMLEEELRSGKKQAAHQAAYEQYFEVTTTPVRGVRLVVKEAAILERTCDYGFFALLSNHIKDPFMALAIYRLKDLIEKAFGNMKERLNTRTTSVSSDENFDGKLFIQFVGLMFLSQLYKVMSDHDLFKHYTLHELIDELDVIERFEQPAHKSYLGEITKKQQELFKVFDVTLPA